MDNSSVPYLSVALGCVAMFCAVLCCVSRYLSIGGGKRPVTCRVVSMKAVLMRHESDAPDFL
jgi:hypothetical protein